MRGLLKAGLLLTLAVGCSHAPAADASPGPIPHAPTPVAPPPEPASTAPSKVSPVTETHAAVLDLTYQRSGGFAGTMQKLIIHDRAMTVMVRGKQSAQRALTAAEVKDVTEKLAKAQATPAPGKQPKGQRRIADAFVVSLFLGDSKEPVLQRDTLDFPATGAGAAWDALTARLDAMLAAQSSGPGGMPVETQ